MGDIIDAAKELASLIKKAGDVDLYKKIVDLQGDVVSLASRNFELEKKYLELQGQLNQKKSLRYERALCYLENDARPMCPRCWENDEKLIHLYGPMPMVGNSNFSTFECHTCHYDYWEQPDGKDFHPEKSISRSTRFK